MPEFRKKPVVIEAIQYQPHENCGEVGNASDCRGIVEAMFPGIEIREVPDA